MMNPEMGLHVSSVDSDEEVVKVSQNTFLERLGRMEGAEIMYKALLSMEEFEPEKFSLVDQVLNLKGLDFSQLGYIEDKDTAHKLIEHIDEETDAAKIKGYAGELADLANS
jgi:hypothetical protein